MRPTHLDSFITKTRFPGGKAGFGYKTILKREQHRQLSTNSGLTQIRLRSRPSSFGVKLDDNNNAVANYLSLYSGNAPAGSQPQLVVTYIVP